MMMIPYNTASFSGRNVALEGVSLDSHDVTGSRVLPSRT